VITRPDEAQRLRDLALLRRVRDRIDREYGGMHWITVGPPDQPGTSIVLYPPAATPGLTEDERRTVAEMMAKGTFASINLATKDLDAVFERPQAGDAEVVQEPIATAPSAIPRAT